MNADYIFDVFETANAENADTAVALGVLCATRAIPDGMTKENVSRFIGLHFDQLRRAYQTANRNLFGDIVAACLKSDAEEADVLLRAYETGNKKLIDEMQSRYGEDAHA